MLPPDQINALSDKARQIADPIIEFLIEDIARRVAGAGQLTSTASYQVWRLQQLGMSQREVKEEIRKRLKISLKDVEQLMKQTAEVGYRFDLERLPHANAVPFAENAVMQQIVSAAVDMAREDLTNMVQTLGFVNEDGVARPLTKAYEHACDFAFQKVAIGAQDYNSAIREATKGLAEKGIRTIDYKSGRHISMEAAVRQNVMGGLGLMQERIAQQTHDDLGCDGWEITAHIASAPDHEPFQGKQYSDEEYAKLCNSLVRRFGTLNCGHEANPIIMGVNSPQYTDEQLEEMRRLNAEGVIVNGKHYTLYEAGQRQRKYERAIRTRKKAILLDKGLGDEEKLAWDQTRLVILNGEYARFSKDAGLRLQRERTYVPGFGPKQERAAQTVGNRNFHTIERIGRSVGAKSKNYKVYNPGTGDFVQLAEGTRITQPKNHVMAGCGRERQIDCIDWLVDKYGGDAVKWTKEKGFGYVEDEYGDARQVELHWYQEPSVGKVEMKIKYRDGRAYLDEY